MVTPSSLRRTDDGSGRRRVPDPAYLTCPRELVSLAASPTTPPCPGMGTRYARVRAWPRATPARAGLHSDGPCGGLPQHGVTSPLLTVTPAPSTSAASGWRPVGGTVAPSPGNHAARRACTHRHWWLPGTPAYRRRRAAGDGGGAGCYRALAAAGRGAPRGSRGGGGARSGGAARTARPDAGTGAWR